MKYRKIACLSLLAVLVTMSADAQVYLVPRNAMSGAALGQSVGRSMAQVANAMREGRIVAAKFEADLKQAREDFANSEPGSAAETDAAARLSELRQAIDWHEVTAAIQVVFGGDSHERLEAINQITFGQKEFGGGLPPGTQGAFDIWSRSMILHMSEGDGRLDLWDVNGDKMYKAYIATAPEYMRYVELRDWYEFVRAGKTARYFASADDYLRFMIRWFPTTLGASGGGLSDERVEAARAQLFEVFGEREVLEAAKRLRQQPQGFTMRLKDPAAVGLPAYRSEAPLSMTGLLEEDADLEAYGLLAMWSGSSLVSLDDSRLRLDAWREQHGRSKTDNLLKSVRRMTVDENGRLTDEPYAGQRVYSALMSALPLDPDPVAVKREQEREQRKAESEARMAQTRAHALASAKEKAGEHLDAFLAARPIAERMDAERVTWFTAEQLEDPRYLARMYRDRLDAMAVAWNDFAKTGARGAGSRAASLGRMLGRDDSRMSPAMVRDRETLTELLAFAQRYQKIGKNQRYPMQEIEAQRIGSGQMAASDAVDWDFRLEEVEQQRMDAYKQKQADVRAAKNAQRDRERAAQQAEAEAEARRREMVDRQAARGVPTADQTSARSKAGYQLDGFLAARELAVAADQARLTDINAQREQAGLEPWEQWTISQQLIDVMAGFWDQHRTDPRASKSRYADRVANFLRRQEPESYQQMEKSLEFMFARDARMMTFDDGTMADQQRQRLADGTVPEEQAFTFVASHDLSRAIEGYLRARLELHDREMTLAQHRRAEGVKDSTIRRAKSRVAHQVEEVAEALAELEAARAEAEPQ